MVKNTIKIGVFFNFLLMQLTLVLIYGLKLFVMNQMPRVPIPVKIELFD